MLMSAPLYQRSAFYFSTARIICEQREQICLADSVHQSLHQQ